VQPPGALDPFRRLGFEIGYALDRARLDAAYFAAQRRLHPDRFAGRAGRERAFAEAQSVAVNDAYRTLRDPVTRAEWLLRSAGHRLDDTDGRSVQDPALLVEAMTDRETLADAESAEAVTAIGIDADRRATDALDRLAASFAAADLEAAIRETLRLKYLRKLADEARLKRRRFAAAA
jgi:molecular chaperone HscB